jgi:hypothetical protein
MPIYSQNLSEHQWKNRLLIVYTDDLNAEDYLQQLSELRKYDAGLEERKLLIYKVHNNSFEVGLEENQEWKEITNESFWAQAQKPKNGLSITLIGLDGGTKNNITRVLPCEELFALIDGMPMRKAEVLRKG